MPESVGEVAHVVEAGMQCALAWSCVGGTSSGETRNKGWRGQLGLDFLSYRAICLQKVRYSPAILSCIE